MLPQPDVPGLEAAFAELRNTGGPLLAWSWLACSVSRALVATQTAIIAGQREMLRYAGPPGDAQAKFENIAALHRFARRLYALHSAIGLRCHTALDSQHPHTTSC